MCPSLAGLQRPRQSALRLGLHSASCAHEEHRSNDGRQANHGKRDTDRPGHVRRAHGACAALRRHRAPAPRPSCGADQLICEKSDGSGREGSDVLVCSNLAGGLRC